MLITDVTLESDGLKIGGQFYQPGDDGPYPTVCVCHGIPARIPDTGDRGYPLLAEGICSQGLAVFIFNFRGCGVSSGNIDLWGWTRDLGAVIDYLSALPGVDGSRLSLFGFSGGAAVSVCVASKDKRVSSLVTCACPAEFNLFNRIGDNQAIIGYFRDIGVIRDDDFPHSVNEWLEGFRRVISVEYIAGIAPRPLLLVHGSRDELVDVSHAYKLYDRAGEPKQIAIIDGAGHRLRQDERAMAIVIDWLKKTGGVDG